MKICKKHARTREEEIKARFTYLIANAILYHTPPQVVAGQILHGQVLTSLPSAMIRWDGTYVRFTTVGEFVDRSKYFFNLDNGNTVDILGKTSEHLLDTHQESGTWVYIHHKIRYENVTLHRYGGVRIDTLGLTDDDIQQWNLPSLSFDETLPKR